MTIRVPNALEQQMLEFYFAVVAIGGGFHLRLFTNDVEAGLTEAQIEALDETDFTEATFTGYSAIVVNGGWTFTQGDPTRTVNTPRTFTRSGGVDQTVQGYYLTNVGDGALAWWEYLPGPVLFDNTGDTLTITPTLTLDDDQEANVTARGVIARQTLTGDSLAYTTNSTTDFALANVEVDVTRLYAVCGEWLANLSAAGDWQVMLYVDGVLALQIDRIASLGAKLQHSHPKVLWEPATGTYDLDLRVVEVSGTSSLQFYAGASGTLLRQFWIEDVGPR